MDYKQRKKSNKTSLEEFREKMGSLDHGGCNYKDYLKTEKEKEKKVYETVNGRKIIL